MLTSALLAAMFFSNTIWIFAKAQLAQLLIERAWSETHDSGKAVAPWSWADFWPVAKIELKKSGKVFYVLSSAAGESLAFGPGHVSGSALPATQGVSIIAGHRDTHFAFLKYLKMGDVLTVQGSDSVVMNYQVSGFEVLDIRYAKLTAETTQNGLKLVTCYPFDALVPGGPKRLVVQLQLVEV